jgi:hypothetical protein
MSRTKRIRDVEKERIAIEPPDAVGVSIEEWEKGREPFTKLNTIVLAMLYTKFQDEMDEARGDADNMEITGVKLRPASVEVEVHKQWYQP